MVIPRLAPSSKGNLHEMAKLYVTRVTSRALVADAMSALPPIADMRELQLTCPLSVNSGHPLIR